MFDHVVTRASSPQPAPRFRFEGLEIPLNSDETMGGQPALFDFFATAFKALSERIRRQAQTVTPERAPSVARRTQSQS
jgi:hypothetical protein